MTDVAGRNGHRWLVTVPSAKVRDREVVCVGYDADAAMAFIEIPYERDLRDIDEAKVWKDGELFSRTGRVLASHSYMNIESAYQLATRAYVAGHMSRLADERRAKVLVKRDQFAAIVRVATGWPIFDRRAPLIPGGGQ